MKTFRWGRFTLTLTFLNVLIGVTIWMTSIGPIYPDRPFPQTVSPQRLLAAASTHIWLVVVAELLAISVALPIGFILTRRRILMLTKVLESLVNIGQTLPTLCFIFLFSALLGLGIKSVIIALAVYTVLPIVRNTYAGIKGIDPAILEAARGMGMSDWQIARLVELPLALPVIVAGIRTSTVLNTGSAAVAGMIGVGGFGAIISEGIALGGVIPIILQGAAPTAALAVALDAFLGIIQWVLTPQGVKMAKLGEVLTK